MCYRCCSISIEARKALLVLGPNKKFCCKSKSFVFVSPLDVLCLVQIIPTVLSLPPACPVSLLQFLHVFNKALGAVREGGREGEPVGSGLCLLSPHQERSFFWPQRSQRAVVG